MKVVDDNIKEKIVFHPKFIINNDGRRTGAIIPYKEFLKFQKLIEDTMDILIVEARRNEKGIPIAEVRRQLEKDGVL